MLLLVFQVICGFFCCLEVYRGNQHPYFTVIANVFPSFPVLNGKKDAKYPLILDYFE